jgi:transcriptional regulator of met regulon
MAITLKELPVQLRYIMRVGAVLCFCSALVAAEQTPLQVISSEIVKQPEDVSMVLAKIAARLEALKEKTDRASATERAQLVWLSVFIPHDSDTVQFNAKIEARKRAIVEFNQKHLSAGLDGENLLNVAPGLLGIPIPQKDYLTKARSDEFPPQTRFLLVESVLKQETILPEIKEDLEALLADDWHYPDPNDVGPESGKIVYPIREKAKEGLNRLKTNK